MNKILSGIIGIVAVFAVVGASAYALFTAQATISGITLNTGTAALLVAPGNTDPTTNSVVLSVSDTLIPGETPIAQMFTLENASNEVDFDITAQLTSAGGHWNELKDLINARVWIDTTANNVYDIGEPTIEGTLANWNSNPVPLPENPLVHNSTKLYHVSYSLNSSADSTVAGKTLSNITFVFTGTQVN